ncbi:SAM-dependent methyltransferase [Paenibacillus alba]|uniref:class I SAM-dependent methyltransferase n=1 Tax=Paenibacillus alba TaxID=1197127 RepID=UPI00156321A3|nr:SAM-dependent methyltransferase [Paenibacillus alba]NQX65444.1 SAM-dependent methyltransferase [Paenibacillus alba]
MNLKNQLGHPDVVKALLAAIHSDGSGAVSFRDYMDICLYNEPHGYYRNENPKIGKQGDFYTSSSIGSVMGEMIAACICKELPADYSEHEAIHVVEWGGGAGRLALHLLDELKRTTPAVYERITYTIIESSAYHRDLQRAALQAHSSKLRFTDAAEWLGEEPQENVYVVANELLDAFPIHRIRCKDSAFQESYVSWHETEQVFQEIWRPLQSEHIVDYLTHIEVQWLDGQIGEINLAADRWIANMGQRMASGCCIVIDYGDLDTELYAAHRFQGSLMCYRQHQAHDNPWIHQGEQDMTAHVNFSACERAARKQGFAPVAIQTQREFLVEQGILQKLQDHFDPNPFSDVSKRNRAIRQLLLSDQMSELFKVLIAMKKR